MVLDSSAFVRLEVFRRRWPLPILVRMSFPDPVTLKRLAVARWVFNLYLPFFFNLRGILVSLNSFCAI